MTSPAEKDFVMVVEDDQLMAQGIADILSIEGYKVETASNGREALMKMQVRTPDLILSDIMMPEMNGHEFCTLVRANAEWRTLPFIFLTALGQKPDHRRGLELGADDYLTKPFEPDDLLTAVRARLKRAAAHQAAADAALADLRTSILTTLNHEFRTPLTYITGYSRLLAEDGQGMEETNFQSCLHALLHGAERLKRLVENVLLVTQIESGELAAMVKMFPQKTTHLRTVVNTVIERQSPKQDPKVTVRNEVPADLPPVAVSEEYAAQILGHLVDNGVKFTEDTEGEVIVSAAEQDQTVALKVSDNGIGIRPDALNWIFETFRQVDRQKQEQQGAGLGLAIVRGLAQIHGGTAIVESELDVGTTVTVTLPTA